MAKKPRNHLQPTINFLEKSVSLATAILFLSQTVAYSAPGLFLTPPLDKKFSNLELSVEIPKSLGSVEETYQAPENTVALIHIQDAHGSYEAQKNIRDILRTLVEQHNIKLVFVEGAQTALEPNLFHFFKDPSLNLKAADTLMRHGEFSGAEMFFLEESFLKNNGAKATGQGIEQPELYRHDLILFRKIMAEQDSAVEWINGLRTRLKILQTHIFSKELSQWVDEWERHQEEDSLLRYAGLLAGRAEKYLGLDLRNPVNQDAYPALLRMLTLKEIQAGMDPKKIEAEKKSLLAFLKGKIDAELYEALAALGTRAHDGQDQNPRYLLEKIAEQARVSGFSFKPYPNFSLFAAGLIFEHEITSRQLFKEIEELTDRLFEALARTDSEKNLLLLIRNLAALKKLLSLELCREEYESILKAAYAFKPSGLIEKIQELAAGSHSKIAPWSDRQKSDADNRFEEALEFYRLARERENFFMEKAMEQMKQQHETKAVLITGGFHTEGLQEIMKQKGVSYALISPKLGDAKASRGHYLKAMMGINDRPEAAIDESQIALFMQLLSYAAQQNLAEKNHLNARTRFAAMVLLNLARRHGKLAELRRMAAARPQYRPFLLEQAQANRQGLPDRAADGGLSELAQASRLGNENHPDLPNAAPRQWMVPDKTASSLGSDDSGKKQDQPSAKGPGRITALPQVYRTAQDFARSIAILDQAISKAREDKRPFSLVLSTMGPTWFPGPQPMAADDAIDGARGNRSAMNILHAYFDHGMNEWLVEFNNAQNGVLNPVVISRGDYNAATLQWIAKNRPETAIQRMDFETWLQFKWVDGRLQKARLMAMAGKLQTERDRTLYFKLMNDSVERLRTAIEKLREDLLAVTTKEARDGHDVGLLYGAVLTDLAPAIKKMGFESTAGDEDTESSSYRLLGPSALAMRLVSGEKIPQERREMVYLQDFVAASLEILATGHGQKDTLKSYDMAARAAVRWDQKDIYSLLAALQHELSSPRSSPAVRILDQWIAENGTPEEKAYFARQKKQSGSSLGDKEVPLQDVAAAVTKTVPGLLAAHGKTLTAEDFIRSPEAADFWRALHQLVMHKDLPGEKVMASSGLPAWTHELWQLFTLDDRLDFAMRVDMGDTSYKFLEQKILELILKINPQAAVLAPIAQRIPQPPKPRERTYTRRSAMGTTGGNEYFETWLGWQTIRTQDDEKLMEVMEYIKRGEEIPADKQRLLPRQAADRSQVRMFTADKTSQNYTATGVEEGETVTPVVRKMGNGDYAIGFEAVSKLTRRPFIVASYVFVRGGQVMTGKPPKSNMEVNDVVPTENMPTTMSIFVREIIYWLSLGIIPAELAKIQEDDLTRLKEAGLIVSGGSGLFAGLKIIFWKNPDGKEIALSKVAGVEDPILKIHKDKNGTWIASLWARARKVKQGEGLPDKITRPEIPLNDLILYAPDEKGFRTKEKEFPNKPVGFEHVEGEIPDVSRTFHNALQARWYVYWLANGGDQIPDEEEITVKHGRDAYLFRFADALQQPLLGPDFTKGKTVRSWVTFSSDPNIRGVRYQNIQDGQVKAEKYFILYKGNQFQLPEEISADQVEHVSTAPGSARAADTAKSADFVPFHASLNKAQRFQIIKERRKIQQKILALDAELKEALAGTTGEKISRLEQIQSEMESLLLLASDLRDIQTTGDFSGKEDLKQTLGFLWTVSFAKQELTGDTAARERFTQTIDRVVRDESAPEDWDFLNFIAAGVRPAETGDEFYGVVLPVDRREPYPRLFPTGPDGPWIALGNYSKDNVVVTVRSEAKGTGGKAYLRVRIYDPARLDTPLNSYYFDHELNRFVDSKEEWKRWLAGISSLGVPGDMIAAALTEGGQVNIFNYFVRGTAGVNVAGDQETLAVTPEETVASGEQRIFGTINMGSALFEEKVHEGFFPFGTSGIGPILFFKAEERNGQKIVTAYGSSNLTEHNEIENYPWIADDAEVLAAKPTGLVGFGRGAEGPLKELDGYDYVPSRNESIRAWVNGEESPLREFVDPDSIKQRGVPMPAPSAEVANASKLRITEGTLGEAVTWRNTVESVFFGELALDLYYKNNAFPAQRGFYSTEAPEGINSFLEAIRRFPRIASLAAATPRPAEPLLMHRPGSWKMGEGRFEILDGVRGKTGKKVGTNVFNNAFKDIEDMGLSTDHVWIEYGYITEDGRTLPVMYFISLDKERKKATLAVRVVEIADNYFRYDPYEGGQDVSNIVIPRAIERGYFRPVSAVVYPELLENRLRLIEREIKIARRPKDGWEGLQAFAQTSLLDQLLEARRFNPQGENWAEGYFYLASQTFREGLARMAAEVHQLYTQTGSAAPADFLRNPKVRAFLLAFENNPDIRRYSHEEPWRLQPLRYLSEQIEQLNASGTAGHSAENLAQITDQIAAGLIAMAQELPTVAFEKVPPVNIKLRERPRKGERGQMMAAHDAIGEAEVTGQEAEGYVLPPVASPLMPPPQPAVPKPIRVPTVFKPRPAPAPAAEEIEVPAETTPLPKPPATPPPAKVVETAPVAAVAPATLGEHPILTLWPKELADADQVLFGELPTTKSRFKRVEKLADAVPAAYRAVQEKNQGGTLTYPEPDVVTLEENFFGLYAAVDLPEPQRAALTQSFQALKAGRRAGRLAGTSPLPAFNVGREWARFHRGAGKKDYAEKARRRQALIWRPGSYHWNKAREPFLKDAKNKEEEEDFLSARVVTEMIERAVLEIQAQYPQMEYFWVEMAPAFGAGIKQHPALYIAGVDLKRKQASAVLRLIEPRRDVFEKSASPATLDLSSQIFGFLAEHGYRLPQEEIRLEERVRGRLELVQKLHESEKLVDDIDLLVTEERKPLTDPQVSELLTRYFEIDFITHLIESRKAAGDRTGTSILDFPFLLSSVKLKPLYEAAKAVAGAANLSKESAALFLNQVTQRDEFNAIFGYQKSMRHEVANILESQLENEAETAEAIRWTKILAQKILALSQSPYPVSYQITGKMPRPVTRKPKEEAAEPEPEVAEPEPTTPAHPAAEAKAIEAERSAAGTSPAAEATAVVEPAAHEIAPAVPPTEQLPAETSAPTAEAAQPAQELSRFEKELLEAGENPDRGWDLVTGYFSEIDTLRAQEEAGQTNPEWNSELLTPHLTDLLGAFDTAGYRATLTLPELRELQMLYSITAYYSALFFKQAGDDNAAGQEWDSSVNHAEEALKIFDREAESEEKNHQRGQEIVDWILALDAENAFLVDRQKQQQSGHLNELRRQYAAYSYGMRFDYQDEIAALEAEILELAPQDSTVRKAQDYRKIYYAIAELERDLPELDMRAYRERAREIRDRIRGFRDFRDNEAWVTLTAALIESDIHKLAADVENFRLIRIDASGVVHIDALAQALHTAYFERVQAIQDFIAQQLPESAGSRKGELRMTLLETRHAYDKAVKELPDEIRKRQAEMERSRARRPPPPPSTPASGKPARVERRADTSWTDEGQETRSAGKKKDKKQKDKREPAAPQPVVVSQELDAELAQRAQTALETVQQKIGRYGEEAARHRKMPEPLHILRDMEHLLLHILAGETGPALASYKRFVSGMVRDFMKKNKPSTAIIDETFQIAQTALGHPDISDALGQSLGSETGAFNYSKLNGRSRPQAILEIARDVTFKLYSLPGADLVVMDYYKNELGLADNGPEPPVSEAVKALQTGRMTVRNILDFVHGQPGQAGKNSKPLIVFVNEFLEETGKELSRDEIASMAHTISASMNAGDLFIGVVKGEKDRRLMGELYHETQGRFRAKAVPHEILTEATLAPISKSIQSPPASISTLEHAGDKGLELEELVRIRVNEGMLKQSGMDWATAISILRQILDDPENLPKLQFRLNADGSWEMGSDFLTLMETVYNRMKALDELDQAA